MAVSSKGYLTILWLLMMECSKVNQEEIYIIYYIFQLYEHTIYDNKIFKEEEILMEQDRR